MFDALNYWLKTSILGLIVLGSLGSLLAAFLIWIAGHAFSPLLNSLRRRVLMKSSATTGPREVRSLARVPKSARAHPGTAYYASQIMKFVAAACIYTTSFITIMFVRAFSGDEPRNFSLIAPATLMLLSGWWALRLFLNVYAVVFFQDTPAPEAQYTNDISANPPSQAS